MRLSCALARATALVFVLAVSAVRAAEPPPAGAKPLTPEQKERLKERDRLASEARKLGGEGRLAEVVVAWEKKVAIEREVFGAGHAAVALSLEELARMQEYREDFAAARKVRREVLAICRKLHPEGD